MVQNHHGAATVSGERPSRNATVDIVPWEGAGKRRAASQETQLTGSINTLRVKGRFPCRRVVRSQCALSSPCYRCWVQYAALAEDPAKADETEIVEAGEVVVSATKTPIPIGQVTSAVEVITGEELERKKIKTVIEALRLAQGVFASSSGGPGTLASVQIRGAQAKHTMVLIDGAIMNSPTDGTFDFSSLHD